ncbi:transposase [Erwinia tracheiphila PSU-1]|nr:transposase [Erwinia tracheiphila PSU-1]
MNRFRRPLTRREKTPENDGALLHFSCGLIVWNNVLLRQAFKSKTKMSVCPSSAVFIITVMFMRPGHFFGV